MDYKLKISALSVIHQPSNPMKILMGWHNGCLNVPGGQVESTDTSLLAAALRELEEETGLPRREISLASGDILAIMVEKDGQVVEFPRKGGSYELKVYFRGRHDGRTVPQSPDKNFTNVQFYAVDEVAVKASMRPSVAWAIASMRKSGLIGERVQGVPVATPNWGALSRRLMALQCSDAFINNVVQVKSVPALASRIRLEREAPRGNPVIRRGR